MLPLLLQRHEIQVLLRAGHSQKGVAARTGASPDTVRRVKRESAVSDTDDVAERRARGIGRPSKAAPFAAQVAKWLADEPELPTQELLRRAKQSGYTGNKTAFYAMVAGARPSRAVPVVRFEEHHLRGRPNEDGASQRQRFRKDFARSQPDQLLLATRFRNGGPSRARSLHRQTNSTAILRR